MCAWSSDLVRTKNWSNEVLTDADLEAQFDLIINWLMASLNSSTGHDHSGTSNKGPKINLTTGVTGTLPIANGGTGQATLASFMNLIYPVGFVVTLGVSTDPATLFGVGTWTAIEGRVIVGISNESGDGAFDTLNETGGAQTVTLDATMIPAHTHTVEIFNRDGGGAHPAESDGTSSKGTQATSSIGGGLAHNNLQPYIVKYVWQRTA